MLVIFVILLLMSLILVLVILLTVFSIILCMHEYELSFQIVDGIISLKCSTKKLPPHIKASFNASHFVLLTQIKNKNEETPLVIELIKLDIKHLTCSLSIGKIILSVVENPLDNQLKIYGDTLNNLLMIGKFCKFYCLFSIFND